jgi:hypothetical protein
VFPITHEVRPGLRFTGEAAWNSNVRHYTLDQVHLNDPYYTLILPQYMSWKIPKRQLVITGVLAVYDIKPPVDDHPEGNSVKLKPEIMDAYSPKYIHALQKQFQDSQSSLSAHVLDKI